MKKLLLLLCLSLIWSCQNDPLVPDDIDDDIMIDDPIDEDPLNLTAEVKAYEESIIDKDSYVFAIENGKTRCYLLNKEGEVLNEWNLSSSLGNDISLESDGSLTGIFKPENEPVFSFGGFGGIVKRIDPDGTEMWSYEVNNENALSHHDVELLPNGNVLFLVWEKLSTQDAQSMGVETEFDLYTESLWEINPSTDEIVWKWNSIDHIVQNNDPELDNFGNPSENWKKIDLNKNPILENGDIMHANGIDYDNERDLIYVSVNFYHEIWVIDHSTSTEEAAGSIGGNYGIGGDLVYRFGDQPNLDIFDRNHFLNLIEGDFPGENNMLVYVNGNSIEQSTAYEFKLPFEQFPTNEAPEVIWSFTHPQMYSRIVSGVEPLKNGNRLITEGDYGMWEITPEGQIAWKYEVDGNMLWRAYVFYPDDEAIQSLNLN